MAIFLYGIGAVAFLLGCGMVAFGVPVSEFSFGNTMITAGTTTAVGGIIVIAVATAVTKLQHILDALGGQAPIARPLDRYEITLGARASAAVAPGRIPFPPKPKPVIGGEELSETVVPPPPGEPLEARAGQSFAPTFAPAFAPTLRNPDEPPVTVDEEEVSLSPRQPMGAPPPFDAGSMPAPSPSESPEAREHRSFFDRMWPPEPKAPRRPAASEAQPEPELPLPEEALASEPYEEPEAPPASGAVAILKSGVVDGMAYKLYVDGSIEAELPQGTLRFASIDDLRNYLEENP